MDVEAQRDADFGCDPEARRGPQRRHEVVLVGATVLYCLHFRAPAEPVEGAPPRFRQAVAHGNAVGPGALLGHRGPHDPDQFGGVVAEGLPDQVR